MSDLTKNTDTNTLPETLHLKNRGACAVRSYDLYDEFAYGADNLNYVQSFTKISDLISYVTEKLNTCNPAEKESETQCVASFGRYDKKDYPYKWRIDKNGDLYPNKAKCVVRFLIRIHFFNDWAIVEIGKKWNKFYTNQTTKKINKNYPIEEEKKEPGYRFTYKDLQLIDLCAISKNDASIIFGLTSYDEDMPDIGDGTFDTEETYNETQFAYIFGNLDNQDLYVFIQEKKSSINDLFIDENGYILNGD